MNIAENTFNRFFPSAEELWDRSGADIIDDVPYFDLEIVGKPKEYPSTPLYVRDRFKRRRIGEKTLRGYTLSDGIDRLVAVRTLNDRYKSDADFIATTTTAWTTTVEGYAGRRDDRIAKELGIQAVAIGAEGSTNERFLSKDSIMSISLAKTAQSEQLILTDISERFSLPTLHYGNGDSRGSMVKPGHAIYAPMYGNEILFTDIKAPCFPDKLEVEDMPKVGVWLAIEAMGGLAVAASLLKEGDLGLLLKTADLNPHSVTSSFAGILPALTSGEAGRLAELAPNDMNGQVVLYGQDILSSVHRWHDIYSDKPGMVMKDVPRGSHAHLLHRIGLQIGRIERTRDQLLATSSPRQIDWDYVRTNKQKSAELHLVVNQ